MTLFAWRRDPASGGGADQYGGHRVRLTRTDPEVSLSRVGSATGTLRVNLHWNSSVPTMPARPQGAGLFKPLAVQPPPLPQRIDLDLCCLWELTDGSKGVVQALGDLFGDYNQPPFVRLDTDDRSGSASGETMFVNLDHAASIKRMLIFVFIYEGIPAFDRANAVVTLFPGTGTPIEVRLDERAAKSHTCAVAIVENIDDELFVRREVRYIDGYQAELDREYRWGLLWARGYK